MEEERKNVLIEIFKKDMPDECKKVVFIDYPSCFVLSEFGERCFGLFIAVFACQLAKLVYKVLEENYGRQKINA